MTLEILIRGGVGSDDFLSEDDNKGDLTTLFVFLYSIMMKELRGSQNNRKKKLHKTLKAHMVAQAFRCN